MYIYYTWVHYTRCYCLYPAVWDKFGFFCNSLRQTRTNFLPTQYKLNKQLFFETFWKLPFPRVFHVLCYLSFFFCSQSKGKIMPFSFSYLRGVKSSGRLNSESPQLENGWLFSMPTCALWRSRNLPSTARCEQ